jgi:sporulation protein YlmC with PRC-barrel domain
LKIHIGADVRTRDGAHVGRMHRVVVNPDEQAVIGIVVLEGGLLSRDVLVPLDFVQRADDDEVVLNLDRDRLDQLPTFDFNEILVPPPTWPVAFGYPEAWAYLPKSHRKRLGPGQIDVKRGMRVLAVDGEVGQIDDVALDLQTGELTGLWVRPTAPFSSELRVPAEWIERASDDAVFVAGTKADVAERLVTPSLALATAHKEH